MTATATATTTATAAAEALGIPPSSPPPSSFPRPRSSLRRIEAARVRWEAHRRRQAEEAAAATAASAGADADVAESASVARADVVGGGVGGPSVDVRRDPSAPPPPSSAAPPPPPVDSSAVPSFDRRAAVLRAKATRGKKKPPPSFSSSSSSASAPAPAPNPFANVNLAVHSSGPAPLFSFADASAAPAPSSLFSKSERGGRAEPEAAKPAPLFSFAEASAPSPFSLSAKGGGGGAADGSTAGEPGEGGGSSGVFGRGGAEGSDAGFAFAAGGVSKPSPFGASSGFGFANSSSAKPSPFGAPAPAFGVGGASPFGGSGTAKEAAPSSAEGGNGGKGGATAVDYKSKLAAFYREHNPEKLSSVDATLAKYEGTEDELFQKLYRKYGLAEDGTKVKSPFLEPGGTGPIVFLDLSLGGRPMGRVAMRLYADKCPVAAENFRALCAGRYRDADGIEREVPGGRTYAGNAFHRIVPGMCLQGGDVTRGDGRGGRSVYPPNDPRYGTDAWGKFKDETPFLRHARRGLLSMANAGADQNSSQFFVTLRALPYLDGKHVVFGGVLEPEPGNEGHGGGMAVFDRILASVEVDPRNHRPKDGCRVVIEACGEVA
ncbi:hypothetical protein ACHAWF_018855 [Thalassiosira exigua]